MFALLFHTFKIKNENNFAWCAKALFRKNSKLEGLFHQVLKDSLRCDEIRNLRITMHPSKS